MLFAFRRSNVRFTNFHYTCYFVIRLIRNRVSAGNTSWPDEGIIKLEIRTYSIKKSVVSFKLQWFVEKQLFAHRLQWAAVRT